MILFWRNGSTATYRIYLIDLRYTETETDDDDDNDDDDDDDVTLIIYSIEVFLHLDKL